MPIEESISSLLKSPHEKDRQKAIGLLCRRPDREAVIALQQTAEIDESLEVRFYARKALAAVKNMRRPKIDNPLLMLIPDVLDAATFSRFDDDEKCSLIKALIEQNRSNSLPCFLELLPKEQNPRVLAAMIMAVGAFGSSAESKVLIPHLSHKDARVRANSIEALELLGNLKLFAYIFPLLEDSDNRVRANAARSLQSIEPFTSFRLLQAMISSGKTPFQASAIYVLRHFISDSSAALVAPFLDSSNNDLQRRAGQTIRILAGKGVARAVELAATLPPVVDTPSRAEEFTGLDSTVGSIQECVTRLKQAFAISEPRLRLETIEKESLQLGDKAVEPLISYLEQETDPLVLGKIYILLGRLYDVSALTCLAKGLRHRDDRCRANAVEAIGMIGESESLKQLVPFLEDPNNRVRGNTILALRALKDVDIVPSLVTLAENSEELYQRTAVYVLAELQRVDLFPLLQKLLQSSFAIVRKNAFIAVTALKKAGYYFNRLEPETQPAETAVPDNIDQNAAKQNEPTEPLSPPDVAMRDFDAVPAKIKHSAAAAKARKAKVSSFGRIVAVVVIVIIIVAVVLARISIDVSGERAAKEVVLTAVLANAQDAQEQGLQVLASISLLEKQATEVDVGLELRVNDFLAAQRILARMHSAIDIASTSAADVSKTLQTLLSASKMIGGNCQRLAKVVNDVRENVPGGRHLYSGLLSAEEIKAELVALASIKKDLRDATITISRLPADVKNATSGLPGEGLIEKQYAAFFRLVKHLPEAEQMLMSLDERLESVEKEAVKTTELGEALAHESAENILVTQLADLNRSLGKGKERLSRCRGMLASTTVLAQTLAPNMSADALLANLSSVLDKIIIAGKVLPELPAIPGLLEKAQANIVRVIAILHQKIFAETLRLDTETKTSANPTSLAKREARVIAGLYARAHALNDTVTAENVLYFPDIDLATLAEELKAAAASVALANHYFGNANALFEASLVEASTSVQIK